MLFGTDLADGRSNPSLTIKDKPAEVVIIHAESFGESLARRLELCADNHAAEIKEDSLDAHLLFFDVPFVRVFRSFDFFFSAEGVVWRAAAFGLDSAGFAAGFGFVAPFWAAA